MHHRTRQRLYIGNHARASLIEHQHDGFSCSSQRLHQFALVGTQREVIDVARGLAVGVLAHYGHYHISVLGSL